MKNSKVYVICNGFREFLNWCDETGIKAATYVPDGGGSRLQASEDPNVVFCGNYRMRKDFPAIEEMVNTRWRNGCPTISWGNKIPDDYVLPTDGEVLLSIDQMIDRIFAVFGENMAKLDEKIKKQGKRIETLSELHSAALNRKSVICPSSGCLKNPKPAAFVINMTGSVLFHLLEMGIYLYNAKEE